MSLDTPRASSAGQVLLVGASTRAAAESAARAGFTVIALDAFGDLDQHPAVRALSLPRDLGARPGATAAARAARELTCDAVVYLSPFDNHPRAVSVLASGRALWGNPPAVLKRVRDPGLLASTLERLGFSAPQVADAPRAGRWLVKPRASGGGRRVRPWRRGTRVPRGAYLQALVDGTPGSVVFVAAGGRAVPLGVSRQLAGDAAFGAAGYRYCGSILAAASDPQFAHGEALEDAAARLATGVAEAFDLVGVNGVDFIAADGVPHAIEVNPRWSASMELVERASGMSVFGAHAAACTSGTLPGITGSRSSRAADACGKAIVFARRDVVMGDTRPWLENQGVRDVPHPGEAIRAGHPVCTVLAEGRDGRACYEALVARAEQIYAHLEAYRVPRDKNT